MKLKHVKNYLSIKKFEDVEISNFSVITGLNGSGKSHLLTAINSGAIEIENIDNDEIILYNYNDFNVFNFENNNNSNASSNSSTKNTELQHKQQLFQSKSSNFAKKINEKKNLILKSFQLERSIENIYIDDNLLDNFFIIKTYEWDEKDLAEYEQIINKKENIYLSKSDKHRIFHSFIHIDSPDYIFDIRKFISELEKIFLNRTALNLITNYGYSIEYLTFNDTEVNQLLDLLTVNPNLDFWDNELRNKFPNRLLDFLENIRMTIPSFDFKYLKKVFDTIPDIYKKIIDYFKDKADEKTFNQLKISNDESNLLKNLEVENGFFNLKDIEKEEKSYQLKKLQNEFNEFQNSKDNRTLFYTEEQFKNVYGESPVYMLNKVLEEYDCNGYKFKQSNLQINLGTDVNQQNIHITLYNKNGNYNTTLEALSSGEKTLLALAFSIYKLKKNKIIARIFLMDELDSALHPSMSKRLINVLYNYFYNELGIYVIISTHSPSTIAFAPEESLLIMRKDKQPRLLKVNKDIALKELTLGVPSFSINYENRRQVFVESKYDVEYYEGLYNIFQSKLNQEISLNFIASGDIQIDKYGQPNSSCDIVEKVTTVLREAGNKSIFGIIDWDLKSSTPKNKFIKVLGFNSRYSIENFLLDPLLIGILLIREKKYNSDYFGLEKNLSLSNLLNLTVEDCQKIIDKITLDFIEKKQLKVENKYEYLTVRNYTLTIPEFIKTMQGHKLEETYKEIYPELNSVVKKGDNHLKNAVIIKVIGDFIDYAPNELLEILISVQEV